MIYLLSLGAKYEGPDNKKFLKLFFKKSSFFANEFLPIFQIHLSVVWVVFKVPRNTMYYKHYLFPIFQPTACVCTTYNIHIFISHLFIHLSVTSARCL